MAGVVAPRIRPDQLGKNWESKDLYAFQMSLQREVNDLKCEFPTKLAKYRTIRRYVMAVEDGVSHAPDIKVDCEFYLNVVKTFAKDARLNVKELKEPIAVLVNDLATRVSAQNNLYEAVDTIIEELMSPEIQLSEQTHAKVVLTALEIELEALEFALKVENYIIDRDATDEEDLNTTSRRSSNSESEW
eukprot:m.251356 g.251356  ORF g.251356 m.251356 type:complete len:188 (-) comp17189_c0_seq1:255-818(-)